jgi:hypothetical protein
VHDVAGDLAGSHLKVCLKLLKDAKLLRQNRKLAYLPGTAAPDDKLFAAMAEVYRQKQERDKEALEQMVSYAVSGFCRWKLLLDYFGDEVEGFEKCCRCDNCLNPPAAVLTEDIEIRDDEFDREPEAGSAGRPSFDAGARVKVPKYGEGVVLSVAGDQVHIEFPDGEQRAFLADFVTSIDREEPTAWETWSSYARKACTACRASSTSTRGGRWTGPSSPMPTATMRAGATSTTWPREQSVGILKSRLGADINIDGAGLRRAHRPQRRDDLAAPGRPRARIKPGPDGVRGRDLGRLGRLQGRAGRHLRAVRGGALPHLHHRIHLRPADLPLGSAAGGLRRHQRWWRRNADEGRTSVLYAYAFGKAQRLLCGLDPSIGPIVCHGAVEPLNRVYREGGVVLPHTQMVSETDKADLKKALVLAPPSASPARLDAPLRRLLRRVRQRLDAAARRAPPARRRPRLRAVRPRRLARPAGARSTATGAQQVMVTHGSIPVMVRWLCQIGLDAKAFDTEYGDDEDDEAVTATPGEPVEEAKDA